MISEFKAVHYGQITDQLTLFSLPYAYCRLRDMKGLWIRSVNFMERYVEGDEERAIAVVEKKCKRLFDKEVIAEAVICCSLNQAVKRFINPDVESKEYPDSKITEKLLLRCL